MCISPMYDYDQPHPGYALQTHVALHHFFHFSFFFFFREDFENLLNV